MNEEYYNSLIMDIDYYNHRICTPAWTIVEKVTPFIDVTYIIKGAAEYCVDSAQFTVSAGDLLCIPVGKKRSAVAVPDSLMECYAVNGTLYSFKPCVQPQVAELSLPLVSHIGIHRDLISLYQQLTTVWLLREPCYLIKARAIFMMILQRLFQILFFKDNETKFDKRICKAVQYISEHYSDQLTVKGMADMIGLSAFYFGDFFKKETGLTFKQYLTSIRLNHAEDMLYSGEYNVNEVAEACGFCDTFYFSKVFKDNRGVSPSDLLYNTK